MWMLVAILPGLLATVGFVREGEPTGRQIVRSRTGGTPRAKRRGTAAGYEHSAAIRNACGTSASGASLKPQQPHSPSFPYAPSPAAYIEP